MKTAKLAGEPAEELRNEHFPYLTCNKKNHLNMVGHSLPTFQGQVCRPPVLYFGIVSPPDMTNYVNYNTSKNAHDLFLVHLINNLSSSIIPLTWITLTVFVVQTGSKSLK